MAEQKAIVLEKPAAAPPPPAEKVSTVVSTSALVDDWRKILGEDMWKNPHARSTAGLAAEKGLRPEDAKTIKDARSVFGEDAFNPDQEKAIVNAHRVGGGQKGKDRESDAAKGNYTREQLREKAEILNKASIEKGDRRVLMEKGIVGEPIATPPFGSPRVEGIAQEYNEALTAVGGPGNKIHSRELDRLMSRAAALADADTTSNEERREARTLLTQLRTNYTADNPEYRGRRDLPEGLWYSLKSEDFALLQSDDPDAINMFVNKWFDALYNSAAGRDAAESPAFESVQKAHQEASVFLASGRTPEEKDRNNKKLAELSRVFDTRIDLLRMSSAISTKSIESIQKGSFGLRAQGLLYGMSLDKGYTSVMYNRLDELMEDERVKAPRGNLTPEMVRRIQKSVIDETMLFTGRTKLVDDTYSEDFDAQQAMGIHAGKTYADVQRAVRSAYDILVDSQRLAVIAARGQRLPGTKAYYSDAGWAFKAFNLEKYFTAKYGVFNAVDEKFFREVKDDMAQAWMAEKNQNLTEEQRHKLGDLLFKDIAPAADFFSSGWRIEGITDQLKTYFQAIGAPKGYEENFALFMRIKKADSNPDHTERTKFWDKAIQYRPEEAIRLLRDRFHPEEQNTLNRKVFSAMQQLDPNKTYGYDEFKAEFGAAVRAVREHYMQLRPDADNPNRLPQQVNFAAMTDEQRSMLASLLDSDGRGAEKTGIVTSVYKEMQWYLKDNKVTTEGGVFDKDHRFADIYKRTLTVDDALLDVVENIPEGKDMIPVSQIWASDLGGDAYVRTLGDIADAEAAGNSLVKFITATKEKDKFEAAMEAAQKSVFNGREQQAKVLRHTIVPYMKIAKIPRWAEMLGIENLPFRMPLTRLQEIYGPHAENMDQDKRRHTFDELEALFEDATEGAIQDKIEKFEKEHPKVSGAELEAEKEEIREQVREGAERFKHEAEAILTIRGQDLAVSKLGNVISFLVIAALLEVAVAASIVVAEPKLSGGGGGH